MSSASPGAPHAHAPAPIHTVADRRPVLCAKCPPPADAGGQTLPCPGGGGTSPSLPLCTRPAAPSSGPPALILLSTQPCFCNLFKEKSLCLFVGEKAHPAGEFNPGPLTRRRLQYPTQLSGRLETELLWGGKRCPTWDPASRRPDPGAHWAAWETPRPSPPLKAQRGLPQPLPSPASARPLRPGQLQGAREAAQGVRAARLVSQETVLVTAED